MRVLVACEFSGIVRDFFFSVGGHDSWSCDIIPPESKKGPHIMDDVVRVLQGKPVRLHGWPDARAFEIESWDLMVAHPPCTYLCNSGIRWLYQGGRRWVPQGKGKKPKENPIDSIRWGQMEDAADFFRLLQSCEIPQICIENPRPHPYATELIGGSTQIVQPWMFGDYATKETHLWLKNLAPLVPQYKTAEECREALGLPADQEPSNEIHFASPGPDRSKKRSKSFPGISRAFATQWG